MSSYRKPGNVNSRTCKLITVPYDENDTLDFRICAAILPKDYRHHEAMVLIWAFLAVVEVGCLPEVERASRVVFEDVREANESEFVVKIPWRDLKCGRWRAQVLVE